MGPLMLDCAGTTLPADERERLAHPLVGGVILFSRNYESREQLIELIAQIRRAAGRPILIAVDHEGGRVQRFREGFTAIPAMGKILQLAGSPEEQCTLARACGTILAYELKAVDIDLSFGPVLDIDGASKVIGDRGFSDQFSEVITLAGAVIEGMQEQGMPVTGKHFPGHGSVEPDSHVALPVDERSEQQISELDMSVFKALSSRLDAVMPAHVIYAQVDAQPAGFSPYWLQDVLRKRLGFDGVIFSDDLSMHGASVAGDYPERASAALSAGCDMVLACNNPTGAAAVLDNLNVTQTNPRLSRFNQRQAAANAAQRYQQAKDVLKQYENQL